MKYPNARAALAAKYRRRYARRNVQSLRESDTDAIQRQRDLINNRLRQGAAIIKDKDQ